VNDAVLDERQTANKKDAFTLLIGPVIIPSIPTAPGLRNVYLHLLIFLFIKSNTRGINFPGPIIFLESTLYSPLQIDAATVYSTLMLHLKFKINIHGALLYVVSAG
jgi:hypothetical protein